MDMSNEAPRYLSLSEAAERLGYMNSGSLGKLARDNKIPGAIKINSKWALPLDWVTRQEEQKKEWNTGRRWRRGQLVPKTYLLLEIAIFVVYMLVLVFLAVTFDTNVPILFFMGSLLMIGMNFALPIHFVQNFKTLGDIERNELRRMLRNLGLLLLFCLVLFFIGRFF